MLSSGAAEPSARISSVCVSMMVLMLFYAHSHPIKDTVLGESLLSLFDALNYSNHPF